MFTIFAKARLRDEKKRLKMTGADADGDQGELNDQNGSFCFSAQNKINTPRSR